MRVFQIALRGRGNPPSGVNQKFSWGGEWGFFSGWLKLEE